MTTVPPTAARSWHPLVRVLVGVLTLVVCVAGFVLGATEAGYATQGVRFARWLAIALFAIAAISARVFASALRGSWAPPDDPRRRRRAARLMLVWPIATFLYFALGLPYGALTPAQLESALTIATILALAVWGGVMLRRRPRAAVASLGFAAGIGTLSIARFLWGVGDAVRASGLTGPGLILTHLLVLGAAAGLIAAFFIARPLERIVERDPGAGIAGRA